MASSVLELRQYTLHPGQRDVLIELFDRQFVHGQEQEGIAVLGQFRNLDEPHQFVWLRGFVDLQQRQDALTRFYSGPIWKADSAAANATMVDVSNVLLLKPVGPGRIDSGRNDAGAIGAGVGTAPQSFVLVSILYGDKPFEEDALGNRIQPEPLACLRTEYAANTFAALPVREGEHAFVWIARFDTLAELDRRIRQLEQAPEWTAPARATQRLRLSPTAGSSLR